MQLSPQFSKDRRNLAECVEGTDPGFLNGFEEGQMPENTLGQMSEQSHARLSNERRSLPARPGTQRLIEEIPQLESSQRFLFGVAGRYVPPHWTRFTPRPSARSLA